MKTQTIKAAETKMPIMKEKKGRLEAFKEYQGAFDKEEVIKFASNKWLYLYSN